MNSIEKEVSYNTTNSYSTLNTLTDKTKNVWFVCHGIGYLSRYFLKYFDELNSEENYIIAPQAHSKYYLGSAYKHVGSSWLTKENTATEIENVMNYFDAVLEAENLPSSLNIIMLGFSQGVSVAVRYVSKRKLKCTQLVLLAGGIPKELNADDFTFLKGKTKVSLIYGTQDEYLSTTFLGDAKQRFYDLFGNDAQINTFEGKHEVPKEVINNLV
jgi:predicted esterase